MKWGRRLYRLGSSEEKDDVDLTNGQVVVIGTKKSTIIDRIL